MNKTLLRIAYPDIFAMVEDKNKYYDIGIGDITKVELICPRCNGVVIQPVCDVRRNGLSCKRCGDGISFGEKFVFNVLEQLHIVFDTHMRFDWSNKRNYDVGVYENNKVKYLLEVQGKQHYEGGFESYGARDYVAEVENDLYKKSLAFTNGFNEQTYFEIDCRVSSYAYIKSSILNNSFFKCYDLSCIDWKQCYQNTMSSYAIKAQQLWDNGYNITQICQELKISRPTVRKYLKQGTENGTCTYSISASFLRRREGTPIPTPRMIIACPQIRAIFASRMEAERRGYANASGITSFFQGRYSYSGKLADGTKLTWFKVNIEDIPQLVNNDGYILYGTPDESLVAHIS